MHFTLIDRVIEQSPDRVVALKQVSLAEEYLADHFPGFPVLPGVMMLEAMVQAARLMLAEAGAEGRFVLGSVRALKYASMVRPGEQLEVEVTRENPVDGGWACRGTGRVRRDGAAAETAVSGRFTMRPIRRA